MLGPLQRGILLQDLAGHLASDLKQAGITVQAVPLDYRPTYLTTVRFSNNHDLHLLGLIGDYPDAYSFVGPLFADPRPEFGLNDPALFAQIAATAKEPDAAKRAALYQAINTTLMTQLPAVPLVHIPELMAFSKEVVGVIPSPLQDEHYATAR